MKPWIRIAVAVVAVIVLAVILVPLFVNANTFRPLLENQISSALGRKVTLGKLSFSLLSGSLVADNVSIADDPAFSQKPFLQAASLHIGVKTAELLFHHQLHVTDFTADSPSIFLIHNASGAWNFSSIGGNAASHTGNQQRESAFPNLTVGQMLIKDGTVTVSSLPASGQPFVYRNVKIAVQKFSFAKSFPFQISASLPGSGSLQMNGSAGPVSQQDASSTPFQANLTLKQFDPQAAGVVEPGSGVSMLADLTARLVSNGQTASASGTSEVRRLKLSPQGTPAPRPVEVAFNVMHNLTARNGTINDLSIKTGPVALNIKGGYQHNAQQTLLNLALNAPGLPIDQLQELLPAVGVQLPSGSRLQGGTLTANLSVTGPASTPAISGPIQISNTRLTGFDLGSKIGGLKPIGGSGGGTQIQTLRANVNSSPAGTRIQDLYISAQPIGTAAGAGSVSPSGALNFHVTAKLNTNAGAAGQALGALTAANGVLGHTIDTALTNGVPLNITGTTRNPVIQADLSKIVQRNAGGILQQELKNRLGKGQKSPGNGGLLNRLFSH